MKGFAADLGADSLDTVELVSGIGGTRLVLKSPTDAEDIITTVQNAIDYAVATKSPTDIQRMTQSYRVVGYWFGCVSPVGNTVQQAWERLLAADRVLV